MRLNNLMEKCSEGCFKKSWEGNLADESIQQTDLSTNKQSQHMFI